MTSGTQGRAYAVTLQTEATDQLAIQGTFLIFHLWARVLFDFGASQFLYCCILCESIGLRG